MTAILWGYSFYYFLCGGNMGYHIYGTRELEFRVWQAGISTHSTFLLKASSFLIHHRFLIFVRF